MRTASQGYDRTVRTVCSPNCLGTCGVNAFVRDGRIVKLEPASFPDPGFERICLRGIAMATERIHHPDRLTHPLIRTGERGENRWRRVSWDEAYDYVLSRMEKIADEDGWRSNAWLNMSGNYGFKSASAPKRVANCVGGTYFSKLGLTADSAAFLGFLPITGSFYASNDFSEIAGAKYFLSVGKNIADTGHSEMHFLFDAKDQGELKFVMVDPRFSRSAAKADEWVAPHPGTDVALALGMINAVVTAGLMKTDYVARYTNAAFLVCRDGGRCLRERDIVDGGSDAAIIWDEASGTACTADRAIRPALRGHFELQGTNGSRIACRTAFEANWEHWSMFTPEHAASICGVPAAQIRHVALEYAAADPAWMWIGYGPQRYSQGHSVIRAWTTLAALCGNIGKPYAGVSIADAPNMLMLLDPGDHWMMPGGKVGHVLPGTRMVETIASGDPYPIRSLWMSSYGFGSQSPLLKRFVREALPKLDLFVMTEQMMTGAAEYADVVLPCVSYYEDDWDLVGNAENWYMQLRRRAVDPVGESRNDFEIFGEFCRRLQLGADWDMDPEESCRQILARHPDPRIRAVDWEVLRRDGVARVPVERPYTPFRDMRFKTPSGRIEIFQEQFADLGEDILRYKPQAEIDDPERRRRFPFTLITYKHVHSTHSQHTILPMIQEVLPEPRLEIAPEDAGARDIADGDPVTIFNDRGHFSVRATVTNSVRPGTLAMPQGFWKRQFLAGNPSDLGHIPDNPVQTRIMETNYPVWDLLCDIRKGIAP